MTKVPGTARQAPLRVAAFTGGHTISSSRFRVRQYLEVVRTLGIRMREFGAPFGAWPPRSRVVRPFWAAASLASRVPGILASHTFDLTFLQREMLSTFRTLEPFTRSPRILDLDDAVWLNNERRIQKLVQSVDGVVCGNDFIDSWVGQWHDNRIIIPTPVDTRRWTPAPVGGDREHRVIGWSGLAAGAHYLRQVERALDRVLARFPDVIVRIISDEPPRLSLPAHKVEYVRWSPEVEVGSIQSMSVGIMPLEDSEWVRGKCSYKMLLYMACGVPVVVTPAGMNAQVLDLGTVGFGARTEEEWVETLSAVLASPARATAMGAQGRRVIQDHFDLEAQARRLAAYFRTFSK